MNPNNTIEERLALITDPGYREFIVDGSTSDIALLLGNVHTMGDEGLQVLENAIDLYLLFFLNREELALFLSRQCALSPEAAEALAAAIILALPEDVRDARENTLTVQQINPANPTLSTDIAEAEAALARVSPVRTMARDMNDLASQAPHEPTVYQSTQPSSLRPAASGGTPPTSPSWGSQN